MVLTVYAFITYSFCLVAQTP